jgi:hypothetical protein
LTAAEDEAEQVHAENERLREALEYVYDQLPLVPESGSVYDKVLMSVGAALRGDNRGQDAAGG